MLRDCLKIFGSTDLDWRSFLNDPEVNAVVSGTEFGDRTRAEFESEIANSEQITLERWRRRSISLRVEEMSGWLLGSWL